MTDLTLEDIAPYIGQLVLETILLRKQLAGASVASAGEAANGQPPVPPEMARPTGGAQRAAAQEAD